MLNGDEDLETLALQITLSDFHYGGTTDFAPVPFPASSPPILVPIEPSYPSR